MPLLVRNLASDTTLFAKKGQPTVIWAPSGSSGDIMRVPNEWAEDIDFLNSMDAGILEIVEEGSSEEAVAAVKSHQGSFRASQQQAARSVEATLDRRQDRDLIGQACIAPAEGRPEQVCGQQVLIKASQRDEVPPLCKQHEGLAPQFYLVQSGSKGEGEGAAEGREGKVNKVWRRVEMTAPQRG